eukprot:3118929-Ditylum_brightwellii.AAC.1
MIVFGMKATLICYQDEFSNYKGVVDESGNDGNENENGFCADIGTPYVYEMNENILNKLWFAGTYRHDGL